MNKRSERAKKKRTSCTSSKLISIFRGKKRETPKIYCRDNAHVVFVRSFVGWLVCTSYLSIYTLQSCNAYKYERECKCIYMNCSVSSEIESNAFSLLLASESLPENNNKVRTRYKTRTYRHTKF